MDTDIDFRNPATFECVHYIKPYCLETQFNTNESEIHNKYILSRSHERHMTLSTDISNHHIK